MGQVGPRQDGVCAQPTSAQESSPVTYQPGQTNRRRERAARGPGPSTALPPPDRIGFAAGQQGGRRGVIAGAAAEARAALARAALAAVGGSALLVVPDTVAVDTWLGAFGPVLRERVAEHRPRGAGPPLQVATIAAAAWDGPRPS